VPSIGLELTPDRELHITGNTYYCTMSAIFYSVALRERFRAIMAL